MHPEGQLTGVVRDNFISDSSMNDDGTRTTSIVIYLIYVCCNCVYKVHEYVLVRIESKLSEWLISRREEKARCYTMLHYLVDHVQPYKSRTKAIDDRPSAKLRVSPIIIIIT